MHFEMQGDFENKSVESWTAKFKLLALGADWRVSHARRLGRAQPTGSSTTTTSYNSNKPATKGKK